MERVYLGGTCNGSDWRARLIPLLTEVEYFDPVVDDWNDEAAARELYEREHDEWLLYVLTPLSDNIYGVAEAVDDSNKHPGRTLLGVLESDGGKRLSPHQKKALRMVGKMVEGNGGQVFRSLEEVAAFLNRIDR